MPNRMLKETIRTSKNVGQLTDFQFRLWIYLISYVDDYGRGSADAELLKGFLFPRRKGVTETQIEDALTRLANLGMIVCYDVDGDSYFYFPNWGKHQRIQAKAPKFPDPPTVKSTVGHGESPSSTVSNGELPSFTVRSEDESVSEIRSEIKSESVNTPYNPPLGEDAQISDPAEEVTLGKTAYTVADVVSLYNSICLSLPRVKTISDARRRQVGARMKMYSYEDFKTLFTKAEASPFLKGANDHNWSADFDWLTKDRNMAKVIDGNYDGLDTRSKNKAAQSPQSVITRLQEWAEKGGS